MRSKLGLGVLVAAVLLVVVWAVAAGGSSDDESPVAAPDGSTLATTVSDVDGVEVSSPSETTSTDVAVTVAPPESATTTSTTTTTTTTTTMPPPIDERLPRTEADATATDPVPVGEVVEATPGLWDIALTEVDLDAAETVAGYAAINPAPEPGYQYVLVTIEGTYLGGSVAQPVFEWAILAGEREYEPSIPGCGIVPNPIYDVVEIAPSDSFVAQLCIPVASDDVAAGIELYLNAPGDDPRFFALG